MRIEIAGTLATGKSTLVHAFAPYGFQLVLEDLTTNPYLDLRTRFPEKYRLICAQRFLEDKIGQLYHSRASGNPNVISDFSMAAEKAYMAYYQRDEIEWRKMAEARIDGLELEIGRPDLLLHLRCRPEEQLDRIRRRGREFEQGHDLEFLTAINALMDEKVQAKADRGIKVVEIETTSLPRNSSLRDLPVELQEFTRVS